MPLFLAGAYVAGAASGMFSSPQQAAVADIIGSKARAGTAVATFQMMADLGSIVGSLVVGQVAQHTSFGWAFVVSGGILLVAAVGLDVRAGNAGSAARRADTGPRTGSGGRRRSAVTSDFERLLAGGVASMGTTSRGYGAAGSAPHWQCGGQGFESP